MAHSDNLESGVGWRPRELLGPSVVASSPLDSLGLYLHSPPQAARHGGTAPALVAFETPHRLRDTLADMLDTLGDRRVTALREATKLHEETFRGAISEGLSHFQEPRGEFTLVIEAGKPDTARPSTADVEATLRAMLRAGLPAREARVRAAAETGLPRREVYRLWLSVRREP